MKSALERFEEKIDKNGPIPAHYPELGPCWPWTGARHRDGYGSFFFEGRVIGAHCASYLINVGPVPNGHFVCHKCDVPSCVRTDHLFAGTQSENITDAYFKSRIKCRRGERHQNYRRDVRDSEVSRLYVVEEMSIPAVARVLGTSRCCVTSRLRSLGIRIRSSAEAQRMWYLRRLPLAA